MVYPQWVLIYGKIYIFLYYLGFIQKIFKTLKKSILIFSIAFFLCVLLAFGNSILIRWISFLFFSYTYYLFVKNFLKEIFKPSTFTDQTSKFEQSTTSDEFGNIPFIKDLENRKEDDSLTPAQKELNVKKRLINTNFFFDYLTQSLGGFRNERSYIFFCLFQLLLYFIVTVLYFSFLNFQLFQINRNFFTFSSNPSVFDFFYYTLKTITFGNIELLQPNSSIARIIEILSFLMLAVFLLVILVSLLFSLQRYKLKDMLQKNTKTLKVQSQLLKSHIERKYGNQISEDQDGFGEWIKNLLNKIF